MIGRNFIVKSANIFSEHNTKNSSKNSILLPRSFELYGYAKVLDVIPINRLTTCQNPSNFKVG